MLSVLRFTISLSWLYVCWRDRHIDKWNRIENPKRDSHIYDQMIFDNGAEANQWTKVTLFKT